MLEIQLNFKFKSSYFTLWIEIRQKLCSGNLKVSCVFSSEWLAVTPAQLGHGSFWNFDYCQPLKERGMWDKQPPPPMFCIWQPDPVADCPQGPGDCDLSSFRGSAWETAPQNHADPLIDRILHSTPAVEEGFSHYRQLLGTSRWGSSFQSVWHLLCKVAAYELRNPAIKCISAWQDAVTFLCFSAN